MARKYMRKTTNDSVPQAGKALSREVSQNPAVPMETMRSMLMQKAMNDRSHRIDLPDAMREKMEAAFGMNFGKVSLYESESVADAGMNAIAQGGNIAFAPGKADFNNLSGQSLLGHELSHVASQARGEVAGSGYLDNSALEARADREGALAAAGEQVYGGPMMDAPSFSAAAPMQANKDREAVNAQRQFKRPTVQNQQAIADAQRMLAIKKMMMAREQNPDIKIKKEDEDFYNWQVSRPDLDMYNALMDSRNQTVDNIYTDLFGDVNTNGENPQSGQFRVKDVAAEKKAPQSLKGKYFGRDSIWGKLKGQSSDRDRADLRNYFARQGYDLSLGAYDKILDDMHSSYKASQSKKEALKEEDLSLYKEYKKDMNDEREYNKLQSEKLDSPETLEYYKKKYGEMEYQEKVQRRDELAPDFNEDVPEFQRKKVERDFRAKKMDFYDKKEDYFDRNVKSYHRLASEKNTEGKHYADLKEESLPKLKGYFAEAAQREGSRANILGQLLTQTANDSENKKIGREAFVAQAVSDYNNHGAGEGPKPKPVRVDQPEHTENYQSMEAVEAAEAQIKEEYEKELKKANKYIKRMRKKRYGDNYKKDPKLMNMISKYGSRTLNTLRKRLKMDNAMEDYKDKKSKLEGKGYLQLAKLSGDYHRTSNTQYRNVRDVEKAYDEPNADSMDLTREEWRKLDDDLFENWNRMDKNGVDLEGRRQKNKQLEKEIKQGFLLKRWNLGVSNTKEFDSLTYGYSAGKDLYDGVVYKGRAKPGYDQVQELRKMEKGPLSKMVHKPRKEDEEE